MSGRRRRSIRLRSWSWAQIPETKRKLEETTAAQRTTRSCRRINLLVKQIVWRSLALLATEGSAQTGPTRRSSDATVQNVESGHGLSVITFVRAFARADDCTFQRSADK